MAAFNPSGMSTPPPAAPAPAPEADQEQRECPVCMGVGTIPAAMGKDEMIQAIDQGMPSPEAPEAGEMSGGPPPSPSSIPMPPGREPLSPEQETEVNRLGDRAKARMQGPRGFGS